MVGPVDEQLMHDALGCGSGECMLRGGTDEAEWNVHMTLKMLSL